jgi:hypothetical protein
MGIVVVTLVSIAGLKIKDPQNATAHTGPVSTVILVYLTSNFMLDVLMILKRIHALLSARLDQIPSRKPASFRGAIFCIRILQAIASL